MSPAHIPLVVELMSRVKQEVCVAWFADVSHPGETGKRPYIKICLAQRHGDGQFHWRGSNGPLSSVSVPAAFLREFRIGDVWSNGAVVGPISLQAAELALDIQQETCEVVPCGRSFASAVSAKTHELPFPLFDWHAGHTMSYVAKVKISATELLVVPVVELVRFYFGSSGALLSRLLSGTGAMETLYMSKRFSVRQQTGYLTLGPDLPGTSASAIGRIAFSSAAHKAARWIESSGVTSASRKLPWYPRSTFPFIGKTNLRAEGIWVDREDAKVFIAFRLKSCSHPFPYERLFYWTEAQASRPIATELARAEQSNDRKTPNSHSELNHGFPGGGDSMQQVSSSIGEVAFPDLVGKIVRRVRGEKGTGSSSPRPSDSVVLVAGTRDSLENRTAEVADPNIDDGAEENAEPPLILLRLAEAVDAFDGVVRLESGVASSAIQPYQGDRSTVMAWWLMLTLFDGNRRLGSVVAVVGHEEFNEAVPLVVSTCPSDIDVCESLVAELAMSMAATSPTGIPFLRNQDNILLDAHSIDAERFNWKIFLLQARSQLAGR
jgi:hypothetical protein